MAADLQAIIEDVASRADEFLGGVKDRAQGRTGVSEFLAGEFPHLSLEERKQVARGVMTILNDDDFFGTEFASGAFDEDEAEDDWVVF